MGVASSANRLSFAGGGFDAMHALEELETLEQTSPDAYAPRSVGLEALKGMLFSPNLPSNLLPVSEWGHLRASLSAFGRAMDHAGGVSGLFRCLDALMTAQTVDDEDQALLQRVVAELQYQVPQNLRGALPDTESLLVTFVTEVVNGITDADSTLKPRAAAAALLRKIVEERKKSAEEHPICTSTYPTVYRYSKTKAKEIWGVQAEPLDRSLHAEAKTTAYKRYNTLPIHTKEGLAEKEYRKRGGKFAFPSSLDTFIPGLHARAKYLHTTWQQKGHLVGSSRVRKMAVDELLLRLRWDDTNDTQRRKLTKIIRRIWDSLSYTSGTDEPISSAVWLDDGSDPGDGDEPDEPDEELRKADNGNLYTKQQFLKYYGNEKAWEAAPVHVFDTTLAALDPGLLVQLDRLTPYTRQKLEAFAAAKVPGSKIRLLPKYNRLQRKAMHEWADARGVGHKSTGQGSKRCLNLFFEGGDDTAGDDSNVFVVDDDNPVDDGAAACSTHSEDAAAQVDLEPEPEG